MFAFVLAAIFVFDATAAASAAFGTLVFLGAVLAVFVRWSSNGFLLPHRWSVACAVVVAGFFIIGVVVGSVRLHQGRYLAGLVWVSCGYFGVAVSLLLAGLSKMRYARPHFHMPRVCVFAWSPHSFPLPASLSIPGPTCFLILSCSLCLTRFPALLPSPPPLPSLLVPLVPPLPPPHVSQGV